ncbi:MAG TPA: prolyl oligopeptidase family serine peptidase [Jatrophihabitantaceae bacterium]
MNIDGTDGGGSADSAACFPPGQALDEDEGPDPYLWLEDVDSVAALKWARERNAEAEALLVGSPRFEALYGELREVLDSDDRIPSVVRRGEWLYNFWQDAEHPRGVWRRTTLAQYRTADPHWELLLDVDKLAESEGENWVWQGAAVLHPTLDRALVELSRGGADAALVREFDLDRLEFVPDGFTLPEAKTEVAWIDRNQIFVATDFGPGSLTSSGYARVVKQWQRGTPLAGAVTVFEGDPDDVLVGAWHDPTEGFERSGVSRRIGFFTSEEYLVRDGELTRLDVPGDADIDVHREWLLIRTRSPWVVGGREYPAGSLLVAAVDDYLSGRRDLTALFEPDTHSALGYHAWTRHHLIVQSLVNVRSRLEVHSHTEDGWRRRPLPGVPDLGHTDVVDTDPYASDEYFLQFSGFTEPNTLRRGDLGRGDEFVEALKREPAFFDSTGLDVEQLFATSADGTRVPYFVVRRESSDPAPTLLTGYGGFEIAGTETYSGLVGRGWLARGGTFVQANIRGGGEYGPAWHQAGLKTNRLRIYEDFAAVAVDLVDRGITTREQLGIRGGSNGGLLMGVMLTRYPELFGAVVSEVPLLDMLRFHKLLAGASWVAEYGDPEDPVEGRYLRGYSPYQNVRPDGSYPPALFVTSTRDDRVHPGHARKMVARMREYGLDVRYYENIEGGHGAAANNEQRAYKWALIFEFLWRTLDHPRLAQDVAETGG